VRVVACLGMSFFPVYRGVLVRAVYVSAIFCPMHGGFY